MVTRPDLVYLLRVQQGAVGLEPVAGRPGLRRIEPGLVLHDRLNRPPKPEHARRTAHDDGVARHVGRHDGACPDDRPATNGGSGSSGNPFGGIQ